MIVIASAVMRTQSPGKTSPPIMEHKVKMMKRINVVLRTGDGYDITWNHTALIDFDLLRTGTPITKNASIRRD